MQKMNVFWLSGEPAWLAAVARRRIDPEVLRAALEFKIENYVRHGTIDRERDRQALSQLASAESIQDGRSELILVARHHTEKDAVSRPPAAQVLSRAENLAAMVQVAHAEPEERLLPLERRLLGRGLHAPLEPGPVGADREASEIKSFILNERALLPLMMELTNEALKRKSDRSPVYIETAAGAMARYYERTFGFRLVTSFEDPDLSEKRKPHQSVEGKARPRGVAILGTTVGEFRDVATEKVRGNPLYRGLEWAKRESA